MTGHKQQLDNAIRNFNVAERVAFTIATATRWLGTNGPTYLLGTIRVKAYFVDTRGRHWVDAYLAVESLTGTTPDDAETYRQMAIDAEEARDLWVFTDTRGRWNAVMTPVTELARRWEYPPPVRLPDGNWARGWLDLPERTDEQELSWIAHGGNPTNTYKAEHQL
ncbi:hypothetical protein [Streptomyces acidiscabies]|uniref:hypothetical protein n=1 Tax=Streptomyces acidiscabies TaxID=42234 RepID=UPI000952DDEF|nr:hypothetical protein [Streptomyces acidiscabies]